MKLSRRELLQLLALAPVSQLSRGQTDNAALTNPTAQQPLWPTSDYKALVCLFLYGGNDSWNLLVPCADETGSGPGPGFGYQTYQQRRASMAIQNERLNAGSAAGLPQWSSPSDNPYHAKNAADAYQKGVYELDRSGWGVNACAPELALLWQQQQLAWVVNTGTLVEPVNRDTLNSAALPYFLYAHNHQQRALASANAERMVRYGWAGRLADIWQSGNNGVNASHPFGLNISLANTPPLFASRYAPELVLPAGKPPVLVGMQGDQKAQQTLRQAYQQLLGAGTEDRFSRYMQQQQQRMMGISTMLENRWATTRDYSQQTGLYGEPLFAMPEPQLIGLGGKLPGNLMEQLESVARLIEIGRKDGLNRQIFFVSLGGFDTHDVQTEKHPLLLRSLSLALWKFQTAINNLGLQKQVTLFTQSDFGRTLQNNGTGTDHAWGGHQLVMGGAVNQGIYGRMPDLRDNSPDMIPDQRGRVIPGLAAEQTSAAIASWFGLRDEDMNTVFPGLHRFAQNGDISSAWLPLMQV
jgi:uncharacterized protein (DUF1501 family)